MGAGLGVFLALSLLVSNTRGIFAMLVNSSAPQLSTAVFVGIFASVFAIGAGITGLIFVSMDDK
jgi:hypothetical protein